MQPSLHRHYMNSYVTAAEAGHARWPAQHIHLLTLHIGAGRRRNIRLGNSSGDGCAGSLCLSLSIASIHLQTRRLWAWRPMLTWCLLAALDSL